MSLFVGPPIKSYLNFRLNQFCDLYRISENENLENLARRLLEENIVPFYNEKDKVHGYKAKEWNKICEGKDRITGLFCMGQEPVGLIVLRTRICRDKIFGVALPIFDQFIVPKFKGKGFEAVLLQFAMDFASEKQPTPSLSITLHDQEPDMRAACKLYGFKNIRTHQSKSVPGLIRFLLKLDAKHLSFPISQPIREEEASVAPKRKAEEVTTPSKRAREEVDSTIRLFVKNPKVFEDIREKRKTIEFRNQIDLFEDVKAGDRIVYTGPKGTSIQRRVHSVRVYTNYPDLLRAEGVKNCICNMRTVQEAMAMLKGADEFRASKGLKVVACHIVPQ